MPEDSDFFVRFWGVRGSIACPGAAWAAYGGNTSCLEVRCGRQLAHFRWRHGSAAARGASQERDAGRCRPASSPTAIWTTSRASRSSVRCSSRRTGFACGPAICCRATDIARCHLLDDGRAAVPGADRHLHRRDQLSRLHGRREPDAARRRHHPHGFCSIIRTTRPAIASSSADARSATSRTPSTCRASPIAT